MHQQGLNTDLYMMYLFPRQTEEELKQDIQVAESLAPPVTTWRSLTYFPGTAYYAWAVAQGKFTEESYRKMIREGHDFYHPDSRFNFSNISNPPNLTSLQ